MMYNGLYDRDYSIVTAQEETKRKEIDNKHSKGRKFGKASGFREYPKAIRHAESLFPNNYLDIVELQDIDRLTALSTRFFSVLNDAAITELDIKNEIQVNKEYHIPASLLHLFPFGHHGAYLFKEFKLGTSYTADYLIIGNSSDGHRFIFVECESPYGRITRKDGSFGNAINKGIDQINDWKHFISSNYSTITEELKKYTNKQLPDEFYKFDITRVVYVVIAGRRKDFNDKTYRLARQTQMNDAVFIKHYDNLYDCSLSIIGKAVY